MGDVLKDGAGLFSTLVFDPEEASFMEPDLSGKAKLFCITFSMPMVLSLTVLRVPPIEGTVMLEKRLLEAVFGFRGP